MENDTKPMSTKELTLAVQTLLEREEIRTAQQQRRRRRRVKRRREETEASIAKLTHSVEVIKVCLIGITSVMVITLVILVCVVWQIGTEAERIKGEVEQIKGEAENIVREISDEAEKIREKIQNPLRTIGGAIGGRFDQQLGTALGVDEE